MKSILDEVFNNIDLYQSVEEIQSYVSAELARQNINAVADYDSVREPTEDDYVDADYWVYSRAFLTTLISDARCPNWLERDIVWSVLKTNKYD